MRPGDIAIYGAGETGRELYSVVKSKGYNILFYLDMYKKGKIEECPIIHPNELRNKNIKTPIFLTIWDLLEEKKITEYLTSSGGKMNVVGFHDMLKVFPELISIKKQNGFFWLREESGMPEDHDKLRQLFKEEKSLDIFDNWILFRETLDPENYIQPQALQYIPDDLDWMGSIISEQPVLADLGAYTGDNLEFFLEKFRAAGKDLKLYFGFETNRDNYVALRKTSKDILMSYPGSSAVLLPLGAWDRPDLLDFSPNLAASRIVGRQDTVEDNGYKVQVAKLDDVFVGLTVDVIKMDIEGAEKEAINGARNLIKESFPVLMISIYHEPTDLFRIPEMIKDIRPDYDFYLRVHAHLFMETVLYCIPRRKG